MALMPGGGKALTYSEQTILNYDKYCKVEPHITQHKQTICGLSLTSYDDIISTGNSTSYQTYTI